MALFKILKGSSANLPATKTEGWCYFTTDENKFYIDVNGTTRVPLNAATADTALVANSVAWSNVSSKPNSGSYVWSAVKKSNGVMTINTNGTSTDVTVYSLPTASSSTLGGIKVGSNLSISDGVLSGKPGTVTSITLKAGGGIGLDIDNTAITSSGTRTITNTGVRSIASGSTNGTISVNTNGTSAEVAVKGLAAAAYKGVTDNSTSTAVTSSDINLITARTLYYAGYVKSSGVTSITLKAGTGISLDTDNTAITSTGTRTITNTGVRSVGTGSTNGTISVNTGGTTTEVAVKGLGSNAYTSTAYIPTSQKGAASGVAPLNGSSKIDATYLPSYVDDVLEYASTASFPETGTSGIIYLAQDTGFIYRWAETQYVNVSADTNTTYTLATGDNSGEIKVTPSNGTGYNVKVKNIAAAAYKGVTDNSTSTAVTSSDTNLITARTLYYAGYVKSSGVTSITLKAGGGISLDTDNTAITSTGTRTITNTGVRAVSTGGTNGTISVNTNGTSAEVAVKGLAAAAYKAVTDNSTSTAVTSTDTNLITARTLYYAGYVKSSGVTSITLKAGSGISLDTDNTAITSTGTRTITNTGVRSIATGSGNGTISVNTGGTTADVAVKGLAAAAYKGVTDNSTSTAVTSSDTNLITARTLYYAGYVKSSGVTSITLTAGTGITISDSGTAITSTGTRTITNAGVRSISTGSTNGTISVNTNGTSAEVAVKGLGTAAYKTKEDFVQNGGNDNNLGSGSPASNAKTYYADSTKITDYVSKFYYNTSGVEYELLFSGRKAYGTILKWGYNDKYLRILRMNNTSWQSDDWEKISAGYADSAGSANAVAWSNVSSKPNGGSFVWSVAAGTNNGTLSVNTNGTTSTITLAGAPYLPLAGGTVTGATIFNNSVTINDELAADSATIGNLIVTGHGTFTNGITGDLTGTASNAPWSGITGKPNSGQYVWDVTTGSSNGNITVNLNGTSKQVAVKGLGSNAYTSTAYIPSSEKGAASGVAPLNASSKIDSTYLPSYVDDVLEYDSSSNFPSTGTAGIIYLAKDTGFIYRWSGSQYVNVSADTNTTYTLATGDSNGQIKITPSAGTAYNVSVKGLGAAAYKGVTDNSSATAVTSSDTNLITGRTLYNAGYVKSSGVTSVTLVAGAGISIADSGTEITSTGTRTIVNAGVRSITTGSTNGTLSVNTNGTTAEVAVKGLGSNAYTSTAYLPLGGGTMTGQIQKASTGVAWVDGRNGALVRNTNTTYDSNRYNPIVSVKSLNGTWDIGTYTANNSLYFSYVTDAKYNAGTNETAAQIEFRGSDGKIYAKEFVGDVAWSKITSKPNSGSYVWSVTTGSSNGTVKVNTNGTSVDVAVKGLGDRAFDSTSYLPLAGGIMTGAITFAASTSENNAWDSNNIRFSGGSRIGEDAGHQIGIYSGGTVYIRPNSGSSNSGDGIEISGDGLYPTGNNTETLGKSDHKWSNVYATTFTGNVTGNVTGNLTGNVTGNASTATKLSTNGTTAQFWRGDNTWSDTISGGLLKITNNGNTVTIGSNNSGWCHFTNSVNIPFYFSHQIYAQGGFRVYNTSTILTDNNLTFSQGGGWSMTDSTWIRTVGSKNIYQNSGITRTDGQFQVGSNGTYFYANSSGNGYFSNTLGIAGTNTNYNLYVNGTSNITGALTVGGDATFNASVTINDELAADSATLGNLIVTGHGTFTNGITGELTGNASTATKLATPRSLKVALGSTTAVTFDGSAAQDSIPVSGTLAVANGGTGVTSIANIQAGKDASGNTITSYYAPKASPTFTGVPAAPTASAGTSTTQIATTAFVTTAINNLGLGNTIDLVTGISAASTDTQVPTAKAVYTLVENNQLTADSSSANITAPLTAYYNGGLIYNGYIYINPSSGSLYASKVYNAVWNDYAEWFEKEDINEEFETGDICVWANTGVTRKHDLNDPSVVGVVSNTYGHILGGEKLEDMEANREKFVPIGMKGRVKAKIIGKVTKGDLIVTSNVPGHGRVDNRANQNEIIGKALESSMNEGSKLITILI